MLCYSCEHSIWPTQQLAHASYYMGLLTALRSVTVMQETCKFQLLLPFTQRYTAQSETQHFTLSAHPLFLTNTHQLPRHLYTTSHHSCFRPVPTLADLLRARKPK